MIKNYELVLIGLLISCSLSNAMDNEEKSSIDLMYETHIANLLKQGMPPGNINAVKNDFYKEMEKILSSENSLFHNLIIKRL